jgi:hypothetical protein
MIQEVAGLYRLILDEHVRVENLGDGIVMS